MQPNWPLDRPATARAFCSTTGQPAAVMGPATNEQRMKTPSPSSPSTDTLARIQLPHIAQSGFVAARFSTHPEPRAAADLLHDMRCEGRMNGKKIARQFSV